MKHTGNETCSDPAVLNFFRFSGYFIDILHLWRLLASASSNHKVHNMDVRHRTQLHTHQVIYFHVDRAKRIASIR